MAQRKHKKSHNNKDAYDHDPTTASPYDSGNNINDGNVVGAHNSYTDNDKPIGPPEPDLIAAIKKGYWWDKELDKEMKRPTDYPAGQTDARSSFSGAIPKDKDGADYCEGVGAKCDADKVIADEAKEKKAAAAEENSEVKKEAEKIVKEEKKKAEKAEKGEGPVEEAPEEKAALAQKKHHHRHHKHHKHWESGSL